RDHCAHECQRQSVLLEHEPSPEKWSVKDTNSVRGPSWRPVRPVNRFLPILAAGNVAVRQALLEMLHSARSAIAVLRCRTLCNRAVTGSAMGCGKVRARHLRCGQVAANASRVRLSGSPSVHTTLSSMRMPP